MNIIDQIQRNKDVVIKLKLDEDGNLIYLNFEYIEDKQKIEKLNRIKTIKDKNFEFDEEVNKKRESGNFTEYEIKEFIDRYHPIFGTRV